MTLPNDVLFILNTLETANFEAFVVGGCVRDSLRNITPKDWDIATSATPLQTKALFSRTIDTGIKHGTITVLVGKSPYEVTTYRIDGKYTDNRRPESVTFSTSIEEDLSRRDFTMNAIAYNPKRGFIDPFNGRGDIKKRIIRCVGEAYCRFNEDALRMLRAVRFAGTLGFIIDKHSLVAISSLNKNIRDVSAERVQIELVKLINGAYPQAITLLKSTGLLSYVLKGHSFSGYLEEIETWLRRLNKYPQPFSSNEAMKLTLFFDGTNNVKEILRDLRFDNKTISEVELYTKFINIPLFYLAGTNYEIKKNILSQMTQDIFSNLCVLKWIVIRESMLMLEVIERDTIALYQKGECFTLSNLAINGNDLIALGFPKGKHIGHILNYLLDEVMKNPCTYFNQKETLIELAIDVGGYFTDVNIPIKPTDSRQYL